MQDDLKRIMPPEVSLALASQGVPHVNWSTEAPCRLFDHPYSNLSHDVLNTICTFRGSYGDQTHRSPSHCSYRGGTVLQDPLGPGPL